MALDIPALVGSVVDSAFTFAESIAETMIFHRVVPGTYDPAAGTDPATTVTTEVKALPQNFKSTEIDGVLVRVGDRKLLIRASELPTKPKQDDYLVRAGKRWDVTGYVFPVTDKLWIVGTRAHEP